LIKPKTEDLLRKADSKFALVMGVARRTRQITDFLNAMGKGELIEEEGLAPPMVEVVKQKPFLIALNELAEGKIRIEYVTKESRKARAEEMLRKEPEYVSEVEEKAAQIETVEQKIEEVETKESEKVEKEVGVAEIVRAERKEKGEGEKKRERTAKETKKDKKEN